MAVANRMKSQSKPASFLFFRLEAILFIVILLAAYNLGPEMLSVDSDLGRHITLGNHILSSGSIADVDILSHTRTGQARPPYEWGSQLLIALTNQHLGLDGVILLFAVVIALSFTLVYLNSIKYSRLPIISFLLTILGTASASIHWLPRPHVFTFLFLVIWVNEMEKAKASKISPLIIFPIIMLTWANMHGGFIFGLLAWLAYVAGAIWEKVTVFESDNSTLYRFLKIGLYSIPASFITPDGWGNWKGVLGNNSAYILRNTQETSSPDFFSPPMWPFLLLLVLTIILLSLTQNKIHAGQGFLVAGMAALGLYMSRNIPLFSIVCVPILSQAVQGIVVHFPAWSRVEENINVLQGRSRKGLWPAILLIILFGGMILGGSNKPASTNQFNPAVFPVSAVEWLEKNPRKGNMFNEFNWGGYLEMRLWPELVFVDSQTDFYGEPLIREYQQVISADKNWEEVIQKYNIQWMLIGRQGPLNIELNSNTNTWALLYADDVAAIYRIK
jgi:hypothetical protein